jgi:hypothetical protein
MIRRFMMAAVLVAGMALVAWAAQPAILVLTDGQRVAGELTYKGGSEYTLNGRDYPSSEIAIVAFESGDPSVGELNQLPATDNPADEHQKHMIVTRDGQVIHGKVYDFSSDGSTLRFDPVGSTSAADRRSMPTSQIARLYITPTGARQVYASLLNNSNVAVAVATSGVATPGTIIVNANQPWTDAGATVRKGSRLSFRTSGTIGVMQGKEGVPPDGAGDINAPRTRYPVQQMPVGGLIGRVGTGPAFSIGSNSDPITMPANGRLYLGINDDEFGDNTGAFTVAVTVGR